MVLDLRLEDWRDAAERRADARLVGTWWRCREHGPTQEPIHLSGLDDSGVYCPHPDCTLPVLQVHAAINDPDAVERRLANSEWRDSAGHRAIRARAGLEPQKPVIHRRLLEEPAPRPVAIADDEDLDVDEGSDAVASAPPVNERSPAMPPPEAKSTREALIEFLQSIAPHGAKRADLVAAVANARPDLGARAAANADSCLYSLRKQGVVFRTADLWRVNTEAVSKAEPPVQREPKRRTGKKARLAAPTAAAPASESPRPAPPRDFLSDTANAVLISLTPAAAAQLDKLRGSDWLGLTRQDVAERVLLEALRRIGEAA